MAQLINACAPAVPVQVPVPVPVSYILKITSDFCFQVKHG